MSQPFNVIFYSKTCNLSVTLLKILTGENLLGYFKLFCVDGQLDKVPKNITLLPTMIVSTINKPLVQKEAFEWINKIKFLRQQTMGDNNKRIIQQNIMQYNNGLDTGPTAFVYQEMVGKSDAYAYTKSDEAQPHSYVKINDDKSVIFTAPEQDKINKND